MGKQNIGSTLDGQIWVPHTFLPYDKGFHMVWINKLYDVHLLILYITKNKQFHQKRPTGGTTDHRIHLRRPEMGFSCLFTLESTHRPYGEIVMKWVWCLYDYNTFLKIVSVCSILWSSMCMINVTKMQCFLPYNWLNHKRNKDKLCMPSISIKIIKCVVIYETSSEERMLLKIWDYIM